jgi:hypothetical protein
MCPASVIFTAVIDLIEHKKRGHNHPSIPEQDAAMKQSPPKEYDGPIVNGHPVLSIKEVQTWFKAVGCNVSEEAATPIAQFLNEYEFLGALWKNSPELREQRHNNPSRLRNERIARALKTLQTDVPHKLDEIYQVLPKQRHRRFQPLANLLDLVNKIAPYFSENLPRGGRKADPWHVIARNVGALIVEAIKSTGKSRVGLGKPTSPAIRVLRRGLAYLGLSATQAAIVEAVRKPRKRKRLGKRKS